MLSAELVDSRRLIRAKNVKLHTVDEHGNELPDHCYLSFSGSGKLHYCRTEPDLECDCGDFIWQHRNPHDMARPCKHLLKAMWVEDHPIVTSMAEEKLGMSL